MMVGGDLNATLLESEGNHSEEEEIVNAWAREGGEVPGGLLEVVVAGEH